MQVKVLREDIPWKPYNEIRPSIEYLNYVKSLMDVEELYVNFKDIYNVEIVAKDDTIKYVSFVYKDKEYFYYVYKITKINNNSYTLLLQLDIWSSFSLYVLELLYKNNSVIFSIRSSKEDYRSLYYEDELLNNLPLTKTGLFSTKIERILYLNDKNQYVYRIKSGISFNINGTYYTKNEDFMSQYSGIKYIVVSNQDMNGKDGLFFYFAGKGEVKFKYDNDKYITLSLSVDKIIEELGAISVVGVYSVLDETLYRPFLELKTIQKGNRYFAYLDYNTSNNLELDIYYITSLIPYGRFNFFTSSINIMKLSYVMLGENDITKYVIEAIVSGHYQSLEIYYNGYFFTLYTYQNVLYYDEISSYSTLPYVSSNYISYVNSTINSANTSFDVFKSLNEKNSALGMVNGISSIFGGLFGLKGFGGLSSYKQNNAITNSVGGVVGGVNSLTNSIYNLTQGVDNFKNKMISHYKDANYRYTGNIVNGLIKSIKNNNLLKDNYIFTKTLSFNSILYVDYITKLYGYYYPHLTNFKDIYLEKNESFYIKIEKNSLLSLLNQYTNIDYDMFMLGIDEIDNGRLLIGNYNKLDFKIQCDDVINIDNAYSKTGVIAYINIDNNGVKDINNNYYYTFTENDKKILQSDKIAYINFNFDATHLVREVHINIEGDIINSRKIISLFNVNIKTYTEGVYINRDGIRVLVNANWSLDSYMEENIGKVEDYNTLGTNYEK